MLTAGLDHLAGTNFASIISRTAWFQPAAGSIV
jgi:hypothetical protein